MNSYYQRCSSPPSMEEWRGSYEKDDIRFYSERNFRHEYTRTQMPTMMDYLHDRVVESVREILRQPMRPTYRILGLGCGPGSDFLGIWNAFQEVAADIDFDEQHIPSLKFIGVDAFDWEWDIYTKYRESLMWKNGPIRNYTESFVVSDMDEFLYDTDRRFDLIIMNFGNAVENMDVLVDAAPDVLHRRGRILVVDKNMPQVRELCDFGYQIVSKDVCILLEYQHEF